MCGCAVHVLQHVSGLVILVILCTGCIGQRVLTADLDYKSSATGVIVLYTSSLHAPGFQWDAAPISEEDFMQATPAYWKLEYWTTASSNRACSLRWKPESSGRQFSVASVARPEGLLGPTRGDVDAVLLLTQQVIVKRRPHGAPSPMFINALIMALQCYLCMLLRRPSLLLLAARRGRMRRACRRPHQCHSVFACHAIEALWAVCWVWLRPAHALPRLVLMGGQGPSQQAASTGAG